MTLVRTLDHVNIRTADLERTRAFFMDVLGLEDGWRPAFGVPGAWLYAGGKALVHLIGVEAQPGPSDGAALDHFAFEISDYEEALGRMKATGLNFREFETPGTSVRQIFVEDANGVTIELNWKGPTPRG